MAVNELCSYHGRSETSYYARQSKQGGMEVSDAKRLKSLDAENTRLKRLLAAALLEDQVIKEALRKNSIRTRASGHGTADTDEGGSFERNGAVLLIATRS